MKQILFIFLGLILGIIVSLGAIKYFKIQLFPVSTLEATLDTSAQCGELKKAMYCYKGYLCEMRCNLCNCDTPYCQIDPSMCTQP